MIVSMYGLWDRKAGKYLSTFTESNEETAKRNFKLIRTNKDTIFGNFPEDFELWKIAEFDDRVGFINTEKSLIEGGAIINA